MLRSNERGATESNRLPPWGPRPLNSKYRYEHSFYQKCNNEAIDTRTEINDTIVMFLLNPTCDIGTIKTDIEMTNIAKEDISICKIRHAIAETPPPTKGPFPALSVAPYRQVI